MGEKFKRRFHDKIAALEKADEELRRERKKVIIQCSHQNSKGKLKLFKRDDGKFECKYCHEAFHMNPVDRRDLKAAIDTLHDAIQQMRSFSDAEKDEKLIIQLGEIDFNLSEIMPAYDRIVNFFGKGKNKEKYKEQDLGFSGMGSISFLDGKKKHK